MKSLLAIIVSVLVINCLLVSCKKDEARSICRISSAHIKVSPYDATTNIEYDSKGRITKTTTNGIATKSRTFSYSNDSVYITETNSSGNAWYIVTLTDKGKLNYVVRKDLTGTIMFTVHYEYDNAGKMVRQTNTDQFSTVPVIHTILYNSAGDAATSQNITSSTINDYYGYTNINLQNGDGRSINNYIDYGATSVTNNHLTKMDSTIVATASPVITTYSYEFNDAGFITKTTTNIGSSPTTYDLTYKCD